MMEGNMSSLLENARAKVEPISSMTASAAKKIFCVVGPLLSSALWSAPSDRRPARNSLIAGFLLLFFTVNALAGDLPDTPPNGWWWYYGQTPAQVTSLLNANNARLITIQVEQTSPRPLLTVAMVQNTGPYEKTWWWYYGQTETDIANHAKELNARVINFRPPDIA
jgi:hypothetical protein